MNNLTLEDGHGLQQWSYDLAWTREKKKMFHVWNGSLMNVDSVANYAIFSCHKKNVYRQLPAKNSWVKIHFRKVDKYCSFV
jgi:hypothetical protein